jgi:molybdopterin-guanine dinucleotide biosynthesis protein A
MKIKDVTGIILCGGDSTRMQTNKALLKIGDLTVIEIIFNKLKNLFDEVIISANNVSDFTFLDLPIVPDVILNKGPLAGIQASLNYSKTNKNFIISCDMPLISEQMIEFIGNHNSDKEILLPKSNGKVQQLCGVYSKSVVTEIEKIFTLSKTDKNIKESVFELLNRIPTEIIDVGSFTFYNEDLFFNMNSPEDFNYIKKCFKV